MKVRITLPYITLHYSLCNMFFGQLLGVSWLPAPGVGIHTSSNPWVPAPGLSIGAPSIIFRTTPRVPPRNHPSPPPQECYESFVCVENAKTSEPVTVKPGDSWRATTTFQVRLSGPLPGCGLRPGLWASGRGPLPPGWGRAAPRPRALGPAPRRQQGGLRVALEGAGLLPLWGSGPCPPRRSRTRNGAGVACSALQYTVGTSYPSRSFTRDRGSSRPPPRHHSFWGGGSTPEAHPVPAEGPGR
jgi:hypothetical protein